MQYRRSYYKADPVEDVNTRLLHLVLVLICYHLFSRVSEGDNTELITNRNKFSFHALIRWIVMTRYYVHRCTHIYVLYTLFYFVSKLLLVILYSTSDLAASVSVSVSY